MPTPPSIESLPRSFVLVENFRNGIRPRAICPLEQKFIKSCEVIAGLPRRQTRMLTWPLVTVWGFIAQPERHIFLKPNVTRHAAQAYGFEFAYQSQPNWSTYQSLLNFAETVRRDNRDLHPRDLIDLQSFIWVVGSGECPA